MELTSRAYPLFLCASALKNLIHEGHEGHEGRNREAREDREGRSSRITN